MINKVILVGRAGKDPDLHTTKSEKKVVRFTLATWENYKDDKSETGWRQETEWHNIVIWGPNAETIAKMVKKGSMVYVEGSVRTRSYDDKDGNKKWITEVVGFGKALNPEKKTGEAKKEEPKKEEPKAEKKDDFVDDILMDEAPY